jgi:phage minor structural protein
MIKVFSPTDRDFSTNGDAVIKATRAVVTKVDNGDYFLSLECGIEYAPYIKANNIIVVDTPQGQQGFRLEANIETTGSKIRAKAWHLYYDGESYIIADSYVVDKNCNAALNWLNDATDNPSPFSMSSDVQTIASFRCVRKNLNEAIDVVLSRWGGHLVRDNFNISIKNVIGEDNGVIIQYRKNLKEIAVSEDWSAVCTKVLPVGKEGFLLDELYLYSDIQYEIPYTKVVSFEQENIVEEDYNTEAEYKAALREDLIAKATAYLEVAQYPAINYSLSANMDKITDVGDVVEVYDERLGLSLSAAVISFEYDVILGKYVNIEFGTQAQSLGDLMSGISAQIQTAITENNENLTINIQAAVEVAVARIWQALAASYVIYTGDAITIVDSLPAESATHVMRLDENGLSFSSDGIRGNFIRAWGLDGKLDFANLETVNFTADLIKGGVYKLGSNYNSNGRLEIYNSANDLIGELDKDGLTAYGQDGSRFIASDADGIKIIDSNGSTIWGIEGETTRAKKSQVDEELSIGGKLRFLPIQTVDGDNNITNDGIGILPII